MRKTFFALLFLCLILCGCSPEAVPEETTAAHPTETQVIAQTGLYDPTSTLEAETNGAVRCYPTGKRNGTGAIALGENFLLFSTAENGTKLTVLSGDSAVPTATLDLDFCLTAEDCSLYRWDNGISFFDPNAQETVVLDSGLREVTRISAPKDLTGFPLLSADRSTLYYCTETAIRALDLETGISRCLKEIAYTYQSVTGLWLNETVLECSISDGEIWHTLFLSTETGAILETAGDSMSVTSSGDRYYAAFPNGSVRSYVFGTVGGEPLTLNLENYDGECFFLPENYAAVVIRQQENSRIGLDYYDLSSGLCTSSLTLAADFLPWNFISLSDETVCFLDYDESYGCNTLYCWDTTVTPSESSTACIGTYYPREDPDYDGLAACKLYAEAIGSKYGIQVLIYKDAVKVQPWDYDLEYEHLAPLIQMELELLEKRLANYPEGFLSTLAGRFDGLNICIVRSLTGTAESGSLDSAAGITYLDGYTANIALAAGQDTEYALYHEMCHLIDTVVLTESGAYDRWEELNPRGFAYDYDYIANQSRNSGEYLREESRSFIDTYSMSFPKEDRARIMEYAMTDGNGAYFQSSTMKAKLKLLCQGIREAFGLRKSPETFLWEQYLNKSLAYTE